MNDDVLVSICCLTYNHEKYIKKTLDGFVNQKTNFKYEVLIHDDASTDGTVDIIREYEEKYPEIIKPIYQTENQYSKKIRISQTYQYPRAKGKYIAMCEGDDYWCSENKLQEQFDIMEQNPNVSLCTHNVRKISETGEILPEILPGIDLCGYIKSEKFIEHTIKNKNKSFQLSSYFFKKSDVMEMIMSPPLFCSSLPVGDLCIQWFLGLRGNVYHIGKEYSRYRVNSDFSWSKKISIDTDYRISFYNKMIEAHQLLDEYTNKKYHVILNETINRYIFSVCKDKGDTKSLLKPEYKKFRKEMSVKEKINYILKVHFKPLYVFLRKVKNK